MLWQNSFVNMSQALLPMPRNQWQYEESELAIIR